MLNREKDKSMSAGEYCNRDVIIVEKTESVHEAIRLMRNHHVGAAVVVERRNDSPAPLGILTDRDIVMKVLAKDVDLDSVMVDDVMSYELVTVIEDTKLLDALKLMRSKGVRRLPVVNDQGGLEGILSVDDILELLAEQMGDIAALISHEIQHEKNLRSD
jgi:CBS domain-containing protein